MRRSAILVTVLALGATAVSAQNLSVIKERKDTYKAMGDAVKAPSAMYKGEADFDLAKVQNALKVMQEKAAVLPKLFPDDAKTGGETEALPVIWENKKDFEERFAKLADDAKAAETTITDETTFLDNWGKVMGNCSGCHKKYRKPKT